MMTDVVDATTRSKMMSGIRAKNTQPEMLVRKDLHARGFRFRLHRKDLPGKPDIVLPRHRAVVLIHGCFWHRHGGCRYATNPKTRPEFWEAKFRANVDRDTKNDEQLKALGWRVATVWECGLKAEPAALLHNLARWLRSEDPTITLG